MKLNKKQLTEAVTQYARKHGHYVRTVRTMTSLRQKAIKEYLEAAHSVYDEGAKADMQELLNLVKSGAVTREELQSPKVASCAPYYDRGIERK